MFGKGELFEQFPYSDPNYRNFYNRFMAGEKRTTCVGQRVGL